jgi:PAS domain-containing protein
MLTKIRERAANSSLRPEFVCGEANFSTIAEAIACAIFISQGEQLNYVNHAAETMTGYAREELLSMNFWDLVRPDCRELVLNRGDARHGSARQYEVKILGNYRRLLEALDAERSNAPGAPDDRLPFYCSTWIS